MRGDQSLHPSSEHEGYNYWYNYKGLYGCNFIDIEHIIKWYYGTTEEQNEANNLCILEHCESFDDGRIEEWHITQKPEIPIFQVHVVFGSDNASLYQDHTLAVRDAVSTFTFKTKGEKDSFLLALAQMPVDNMYAVIEDIDTQVLDRLSGMKGFINISNGNTYQEDPVDNSTFHVVPDMDEEPVHLNDIEVSDWWLSL